MVLPVVVQLGLTSVSSSLHHHQSTQLNLLLTFQTRVTQPQVVIQTQVVIVVQRANLKPLVKKNPSNKHRLLAGSDNPQL